MGDDTTLGSVFHYAAGGPLPNGTLPVVHATYVEHNANAPHPPSDATSDMVLYANGPMVLSADGTQLTCKLRLWKNIEKTVYSPTKPGEFPHSVGVDEFADSNKDFGIAITVSSAGEAKVQKLVKDKPAGGFAAAKMNATYKDGLFVEVNHSQVTSLSFTFGSVQAPPSPPK